MKIVAQYTERIDPDDESRRQIQENILKEMRNIGSAVKDEEGKVQYTGEVTRGKRLDIIIGFPASGKSTAIINDISSEFGSRLIDSDEAKKMIPEFDNGYGTDRVHKESQKIEGKDFEECSRAVNK